MYTTALHDIVYCISSALCTHALIEWLIVKLKRKTSLEFGLYQYSKSGKIIQFFGLCYTLYFIFYLGQFYAYYELLLRPVLPCMIIAAFRQINGYSKAEMNTCLKDSRSIGAYWAHQAYDAYYKLVLENIIDRMTAFEKEHDIHISFKKLIIIIPLSCNTEGTLNEKDDAMKDFGFLKPIENDQGANVNRIYKNPVYRISLVEDIFVVAEFSNPVATLWKSRCSMEEEKRIYIRDCYIKTLRFLVQGSPCIIVKYDDAANGSESLSRCILSSIKGENNYFV